MKIEDLDDFCQLWEATQETMAGGKKLSGAALAMVFEDLEDYPLEVIKQCVKRHRKSAQFAPTVFDVITMINEQTGNKHIGVEEAWTIAQALFDESNIVIATPEIFSAWCVASDTDKYSAAKAFKEKYSELVKNAGFPEWQTYGGTHKQVPGGYPLPPRLFNPERQPSLSVSQKKALQANMERFSPSATTVQKLLERAEKQSGNVVVFPYKKITPEQGLALLKSAINSSLTLEKTSTMLLNRHNKCLRKLAKQKLNEFKKQNPSLEDHVKIAREKSIQGG